ncbi:glycoside hydrolase family 5 protein [Parvularcula sp. LCG005]|uniref:glycoside hydrolase family 5 protein n=1 Tax=Parvularcula sp. LCG005 TaxID=3078805 RepID=UPI00294210FC|nr:glycoside hydrolase family 5 protein [Parvularcula sp. LCG005]WOI52171.1 glycoside hydrolase family 5 protein [Parvularcula sp. LCG005]
MNRFYALTCAAALALTAMGLAASSQAAELERSSAMATVQAFPDYNTEPAAPDATGMDSDAKVMAKRMHLGWNLGNTLEATGGETAWGNPLTPPALFKIVKESGFDAVRLPVSWDQYADQDTAEIEAAWLDRVETVVQAALDADLAVVINIHWDGGWLEEHLLPASADTVDQRQRAYWQQIATRFRDYDERLVFASANEPNVDTAEQMTVLARYHQTFVDTVRATGGRNAYRNLIVQGPRTDFERTNDLWTDVPTDSVADRLMMELHFYTPYQFTLMVEDQDWGQMFWFWGKENHSRKKPSRNSSWGEEDQVDDLFDKVERQFVDKGIPVIIGEYAAMLRGNLKGKDLELHLASRADYLEFVTKAAMERGMVPFYWDAGGQVGQGFGLFDRENLKVTDEAALNAIMDGAAAAE